ncbi:hypothetical protein ANN_11860 [Periplaneta americana]|uniref:Uncharacterized protein n=1 Tax=Periplaneta americana TaxID=6978 RepID=A0ABQ8T7C3_PERAM|nr:hypothetical protein ANN_11860 [Periplaneta americana]
MFYIETNVSYIFALHLCAFGRCYIWRTDQRVQFSLKIQDDDGDVDDDDEHEHNEDEDFYGKSFRNKRLESKHYRRNSGSDNGCTGQDFPKYGAPGSVLSGCRWCSLLAHLMMFSNLSQNENAFCTVFGFLLSPNAFYTVFGFVLPQNASLDYIKF